MLSLEQAQQTILARLELLGAEQAPLPESVGRFLRGGISSTIDLPIFDNSAMDGYAVRHVDLILASPETPARLACVAKIGAGEQASTPLKAGECARVFTGSPIPEGANAVVMQEDVEVRGGAQPEVLFREPAKPFENVRLRGEDVRSGSELARNGQRVTATLAGLLAACGKSEVTVGRRMRVGVLATGSELQEPGTPLRPGGIYESNRTMLAALLKEIGVEANTLPLVADTLDATGEALEGALMSNDAVITSGGVSVGEFDFVKEAMTNHGGEVEFWRVAIKPGKPFVFGKCAGKPLFGLPGNPVSALVTFLLLVRPALLRMQGAAELFLPQVRGQLAERLSNRGDRRHFVRVQLTGAGEVLPSGPQASHRLGALGTANGLLDLKPGATLEAGEQVKVFLWDRPME